MLRAVVVMRALAPVVDDVRAEPPESVSLVTFAQPVDQVTEALVSWMVLALTVAPATHALQFPTRSRARTRNRYVPVVLRDRVTEVVTRVGRVIVDHAPPLRLVCSWYL